MNDFYAWLPSILSAVAVLLSLAAVRMARKAKRQFYIARVLLESRIAQQAAIIAQLRRALEQTRRTDPAPSFSARALEDRVRELE